MATFRPAAGPRVLPRQLPGTPTTAYERFRVLPQGAPISGLIEGEMSRVHRRLEGAREEANADV